jgi:nucleotide-binding universal stress UspA family protein
MNVRKILCPIDFSPGSGRAMGVAVRLANESDAELELVHAWYLPPTVYSPEFVFPAETVQQIVDDAEHALAAAVAEAKGLGARRVSARLLSGVPWRMIVDTAEDPTIDLIVIGTHGRTGLARVLLGSVAEKVIRHAACSVMAVRPDGEIKPFDRVLCATDFSDSARYAAEVAGALVQPGGAGVALLHVLELPVAYAREPHPPDIFRALDERSAAVLDKWATELRASVACPVEARSLTGHAGAQILRAIDNDRTIDLVVLGSHGRTGIKRLLLGSVAEQVARYARCPVLVARKRL